MGRTPTPKGELLNAVRRVADEHGPITRTKLDEYCEYGVVTLYTRIAHSTAEIAEEAGVDYTDGRREYSNEDIFEFMRQFDEPPTQKRVNQDMAHMTLIKRFDDCNTISDVWEKANE